jgi:hypothetical protein
MDRNRTPKHEPSGIQKPMPLAPGNAKAAEPVPKHVTAAHAVPPYLDSSKAKWTKERIAATFGAQPKPKTGAPDASDLPSSSPTVRANPSFKISTGPKPPKRSF